jgi:hypothetical protein
MFWPARPSKHDHGHEHRNGDRDKQPYRGREDGRQHRPIGIRRNESEEAAGTAPSIAAMKS